MRGGQEAVSKLTLTAIETGFWAIMSRLGIEIDPDNITGIRHIRAGTTRASRYRSDRQSRFRHGGFRL